MAMITGPAILNLPKIMLPLITEFNDYFYFLLEGGRGSAKTHSVARLIAYIGDKRKVRVFCGRETQSAIKDSVYAVFCDLISTYRLDYRVLKDKILHRTTGTEIIFKGFREDGSVNIKGLEKVDILWIDEAEAITQTTLNIIIPTIVRLKNFKLIFTMNRYKTIDPVYGKFRNRDDCLHITVNYPDNPYCSEQLLKEANDCRINEPDEYKFIWLGQPRADADNYLFNSNALDLCLTRTFPHDSDKYHGRVMGCDVARFGDNYSAGLVLDQCGPDHWEERDLQRWKGQDAVYTTGKFTEMIHTYNPDCTIVDADGLGGPVYDFMSNARQDIYPFHGGMVDRLNTDKYRNWRTYGYLVLSDLVNSGRLRLRSQFIIDQLKEIQYEFDVKGRKYIIPKEQLIKHARKRGVPYNSPDEADALMMAVTRIEEIKLDQANMFTRSHGRSRGKNQTYSFESNLL